MKPSAVLSALLAVALPAVRGAALDRSRYCIYACPTSTSSGGIWVSSVRAGVLRCLYSDHASCLYSKVCTSHASSAAFVDIIPQTDGALVDDSSADACTPHAPQSCACELTCAGSSVLSAQVAGERTAATPDALVCTYARGLACAYHPVRPLPPVLSLRARDTHTSP